MRTRFEAKSIKHGLAFIVFISLFLSGCDSRVVVTPVPTLTPKPQASPALDLTATPQPDILWSRRSFSPDGKWVAANYLTSRGLLAFFTFRVEARDGSARWELEPIPIENKPPLTDRAAPLLWSKDGRTLYIEYVGMQDGCIIYPTMNKGLYALDLSNGKIAPVLEDGASEIAFSPDETRLAYFSGEAGLKILDFRTGAAVELENLAPDWQDEQISLIWSPDGRRLAYTIMLDICDTGYANSIVLVNASDGSQKILLKEDTRHLGTARWLDEDRILLQSWSDHAWYVFNVATGDLKPLSP